MLNNTFAKPVISIGIVFEGGRGQRGTSQPYGRWLALIKKALKDAKQQHKRIKSEKGALNCPPPLKTRGHYQHLN